ncbi:MAG: hypothetical protein AB2689_05440 [Candidatus Thiodiazotropha taylori]
MNYAQDYRLLFYGVVLISSVIGLLVGASTNPIAHIVLPLIFSLITAGGIVFVVVSKDNQQDKDTPSERATRARLTGLQLVAFSIGFLPSLWLGGYVQHHVKEVFRSGYESAFEGKNSLSIEDLSTPENLRILIKFDETLERAGVGKEKRVKILRTVSNNTLQDPSIGVVTPFKGLEGIAPDPTRGLEDSYPVPELIIENKGVPTDKVEL